MENSVEDHRGAPALLGDLEPLFAPQGIAYVGLPRRGRSLGGLALRYGLQRSGRARIYAVHPELTEIEETPCVRSVRDIEGPLDVAFITVPPPAVRGVVEDCAERGVRFAIVGSSGFAEAGRDGTREQLRVLDAARAGGVRLLGPNCNGLWNVGEALSIGFNTAHGHALRHGGISVIAQTGALLGSFLAGVHRVGGGLARAISTGNEADIDAAECFLHLSRAADTRVVVMLLDSITQPDVFAEAAMNAAERGVPVIAYHFGKSLTGRRAAELHSSRVGGGPRAFSAWLRSLGIVKAPDLESAMYAAALLDSGHRGGVGLGAVSTSGGGAAMLADLAEEYGLDLPPFSDGTAKILAEQLDQAPPAMNPLDLGGRSNDPKWLAETLSAVFDDPGLNSVLLLSTLLPPQTNGVAPVGQQFAAIARGSSKPACAYAVGPLADEHRADLTEAGVLVADSGASFFGALQMLRRLDDLRPHQQLRDQPQDAESEFLDLPGVGPGSLVLHDEARPVLEQLGIRFPDEASASSPDEASALFGQLGGRPVAMKLLDRDVPHKASAGGVVLGVTNPAKASEVAGQLLGLAATTDARVLMQVMSEVVAEVFLGTVVDQVAGPVVIVGRGGSDVENDPDVVVMTAPIDREQAVREITSIRSVMDGLRLAARLSGRPVGDMVDELVAIAVAVSQAAWSNRNTITSLDINPLVADTRGRLVALDTRIQLNTTPDQATPPERG